MEKGGQNLLALKLRLIRCVIYQFFLILEEYILYIYTLKHIQHQLFEGEKGSFLNISAGFNLMFVVRSDVIFKKFNK